jgi:nucleotide-binding universal stress UspA family protein
MAHRRTRTVIAAHDGSSRDLDVIERAFRIAEGADARLLIVHVIDTQTPYWSQDPDHQHLLRAKLKRIFDPAREVAGPNAETRAIGARTVVEGLVGVANDEGANVVVIGSTHRNPLGHAVHGDVARQVAKRCECYVDVAPIGEPAAPRAT